MVCFVILIGLQEAHFEPFRAQAREQAKTGPRRLILSLLEVVVVVAAAVAVVVVVDKYYIHHFLRT